MKNLSKTEWQILIGLLLLSFVPCVGGVFRLIEMGIGSGLLPENPRIQSSPFPVVIHILTAVAYCIIGIFQFLPSFRGGYPMWHRLSGRLLVGAGVISAITGLWMTHYFSFSNNLQGNLLYSVRIVVGLSMVVFILLGLVAAMKKRIVPHRVWMIRAYALGQGAGTQVIISLPWFLMVGEPIGFFRDVLMTMGWVINILIAERVIDNLRKREKKLQYH